MKRLLAKILVFALVFQILGVIVIFEVDTAMAATEGIDEKSGLPYVNEIQVTERIKELAKLLEINEGNLNEGTGARFTVNGAACGHATSGTCSNCSNTSIVETKGKWFEKTFGYTVDVDYLPGQFFPNNVKGPRGYTCFGFANFALWYVAKVNSNSSVYKELVGVQGAAFSKANLEKYDVRIGDVIRIEKKVNGKEYIHSFMFLSFIDDRTIEVLDCNYVYQVAADISLTKIHPINIDDSYAMAITRASNYEPDYNISLPETMDSSSSTEAKANILAYASLLEGWNRNTFISAGCTDIPSGDWCAWFVTLCAKKVGIGDLFSAATGRANFCKYMINDYGAEAWYYSDSSFLTENDKAVLSDATAVTKSTFTPQPGDIYILHEDGYDGISQIGFVIDVVDGYVHAVVGNNGTAEEVQIRASENWFYQISNSSCPIIGYIRPNYASLDEVPLTGISLSATSATLNVGDTKTLTVNYNPSNTTDGKTVTWKTSDSSVATVSNGKITAKGPGTATITAICGSRTATCKVTVKQPLTGISLSATSATLNAGDTKTLTVNYNPSNTTDGKTVTWKTSDSSIATVSNGKITAVASGTAIITATCGRKTATCTVTVKQPLESIQLSDTTLNMNVGTKETLTVTYNPSNTTDSKTITWKSSNTKVVTVSNGKITAVAPGTATITATCGNKSATCTVSVKQPLTGITMSSSKLTLKVGDSDTLTIVYNESNTTDNKTITWKSSNSNVATVSSGKVVAIAPGTTTITATCGSNSVTCEVTVRQPLSNITLDKTNMTMDIGDSSILTVNYNPSNTTDSKTIVWNSSNESVVVVSNGKVTAVGAGTATVTAVCGEKKTSCTVKVNEPEIDVSISETSIDLEVGSSKTIELTYNFDTLPENKTIQFKSSNPSVATVSETGVVTAVSSGTVMILVETNDGEQLAACEVRVQTKKTEDTQESNTNEPDGNESTQTELDTEEINTDESNTDQSASNMPEENETLTSETDTVNTQAGTSENEDKDMYSSNNDVNTILIVIAVICGIGMVGMSGVVLFLLKKKLHR